MNRLNESITGLPTSDGPKGADVPGPAAFQPGSGPTATPFSAHDWDALDQIVQGALAALSERVLAREPNSVWKSGRTATRAFPLFTYRVFYHLDGDDYDPIVVGVTFTVRDPEVRVAGDISGDESGFVYYDEGCTIDAPAEPLAVREAARAVANRLASQDAIVADAIRNRHPRAMAR
jgi:hypothetical protein